MSDVPPGPYDPSGQPTGAGPGGGPDYTAAPNYGGTPDQGSAPNYGQQAPPEYGQQPPAPNYGQQPPPGYYPPPPGYGAPQGYGPPPYAPTVPGPRPVIKGAAAMTIAGAVAGLIGVFLPWVSGGGESVNGLGDGFVNLTDGIDVVNGPGYFPLVMAAIVLGLGIALFAAGRVLAVAIVAIVASSLYAFSGLFAVSLASDTADFAGADMSAGPIVVLVASLLSLAGSIWATSVRRRPVQQRPYG